MLEITVRATPGTDIAEAAQRACRLAYTLSEVVHLIFNDVSVYVYPSTSPGAVLTMFSQRRRAAAGKGGG